MASGKPKNKKSKSSEAAPPPRPHDALVKKIFSDPDNARLELQAVLPPELVKVIDWATLEVLPPSFIDGAFVETQADLLFRVEIAGRDARLYVVFEHKSDAKARALVQVGGYVMDVLDQYFEQGGKLPAPVVIPVILHHSESGWTVARSFHELFDEALLALPGVREHGPRSSPRSPTPRLARMRSSLSCATFPSSTRRSPPPSSTRRSQERHQRPGKHS